MRFFQIYSFSAVLFLLSCSQLYAAPKPNFVILIADDMGWRDVGFNGNSTVKTPVLDEMAAKGVRMDFFYAAGAVCCPGRYAILSGRQPFRGRVIEYSVKLRQQERMIPVALRPAGYRSGYFGKWHLGAKKTGPVPMGFDEAIWTTGGFELDGQLPGRGASPIQLKGDGSVAIVDLALEYIREQTKKEKPFIVMIAFSSPHRPHTAAPEFKALYKGLPDKQSNFLGEISGVDAAVGNLRRELKRLGISENTLVWFTSDNGGASKESRDPARKGKGHIGARTVSVLEWPGHLKSTRITVPCSQIDILPTIAELAGIKLPERPILDGVSLVPAFDAKSIDRKMPLGFLEQLSRGDFDKKDFMSNTGGISIEGKYKLYIKPEQPARLFDIYEDTFENNNLAGTLPDVVKRMQTAFEEWKSSVKFSYDGKDLPLEKGSEKSTNE